MGEARAAVARRSDRRNRATMMMNVNWESDERDGIGN
jgi:hypothetical protein